MKHLKLNVRQRLNASSAMQRSIGFRQLAAASRQTARRAYPLGARFYSEPAGETSSQVAKDNAPKTTPQDAPGARLSDGSLIRQEGASDSTPRHQPDYNVVVDYRTSTFSPVPKQVMDGSEPGDILPAAVLSGAPTDLQARTVRIYRPAKPATQSGAWHEHEWQMDWDPLPKGHRWENPLIGWQSSADFMQGHRIMFKSKEDAINFANKQGYEYFVQEPNERKFTPKAYANNFTHSPKKLKIIRTK